MQSGQIGYLPPVDPEQGVPWNLQLNQIQGTMASAKTADTNRYMNETVNPEVNKARADMAAMGNRGSFGEAGIEAIRNKGIYDAGQFGEEAASRAFGNMINLRNQYLGAQDRAQSNQANLASQLGSGSMRTPTPSGMGASDGYSSGVSGMTKGKALMGALQGVTNYAAQNPYLKQGYKSGGLFGAAAAVPRAVGNILFGI